MQILNIAGYKFIHLSELGTLRDDLFTLCTQFKLKGTILLSNEGINMNMSGTIANIAAFRMHLNAIPAFADLTFRESYSDTQPFKRLKIKIKKEIITMRRDEVNATVTRAPDLSPEILKQWLDEKRDITLLDTRNDYEIRFGTFSGAVNLHLKHFSEFPDAVKNLDRTKPVVMFCTGGIRCEKAALHMLNDGFTVYQLDGGILNYFANVGGTHYEGECFIFDERIAVNSQLQQTGTVQCAHCQGPIKPAETSCAFC